MAVSTTRSSNRLRVGRLATHRSPHPSTCTRRVDIGRRLTESSEESGDKHIPKCWPRLPVSLSSLRSDHFLRHKEAGLEAAGRPFQAKPGRNLRLWPTPARCSQVSPRANPQWSLHCFGSEDLSRSGHPESWSVSGSSGFSNCNRSLVRSTVAPQAFRWERPSTSAEFPGTACATKRTVFSFTSHSKSTECYRRIPRTSPDERWNDDVPLFTEFHMTFQSTLSDQTLRTTRVWYCTPCAVTHSKNFCVLMVAFISLFVFQRDRSSLTRFSKVIRESRRHQQSLAAPNRKKQLACQRPLHTLGRASLSNFDSNGRLPYSWVTKRDQPTSQDLASESSW